VAAVSSSNTDSKLPAVVVATTSKIKVQAVTDALPKLRYTVVGVEAKSRVAEQPVGKDQTKEGAENRLRHAQSLHARAFLYVSIENGLYERDGEYYDAAYVCGRCMKQPSSGDAAAAVVAVWSDEVKVPTAWAQLCLKTGKLYSDCGKTLQPDIKMDVKDPHLYLTDGKKPRLQFLVDAIKALLAKLHVDTA